MLHSIFLRSTCQERKLIINFLWVLIFIPSYVINSIRLFLQALPAPSSSFMTLTLFSLSKKKHLKRALHPQTCVHILCGRETSNMFCLWNWCTETLWISTSRSITFYKVSLLTYLISEHAWFLIRSWQFQPEVLKTEYKLRDYWIMYHVTFCFHPHSIKSNEFPMDDSVWMLSRTWGCVWYILSCPCLLLTATSQQNRKRRNCIYWAFI